MNAILSFAITELCGRSDNRWVRNIALAGLLLSACGSTLAGASPSPAPSASAGALSTESPSATRGLTGALPGSVVRITVNGAPYDPNVTFQLQPTGRPVVIEMAFPFAVDRSFMQTWIPANAPAVWVDDRTLRLTYPDTETVINFKIPETRAADQSATVGIVVVRVDFPASRVVSTYTVAELAKGSGVPTPATSVRVVAPGILKVAPDGRHAIVLGTLPTLVDLATRATTPLTEPGASDGPFVFADWLADGRLMVVGRSVWVGDASGAGMRKVADAIAALGATPSTAVPSPSGDRVALSAYVPDGHIALVDLRTGSVSRVSGPFRRFRPETAISFAWSNDGTRLAGMDSDSENLIGATRVRIVDLATDDTVRTIEGSVLSIASFPTGELLLVRDSDRIREYLGVVTGWDGVEHRRYTGGGSWWMSPDAKYLLQQEPNGGAGYPAVTLIDLATGRSSAVAVPLPFVGWLADDRLVFADGR
jgi:hypothetical protein